MRRRGKHAFTADIGWRGSRGGRRGVRYDCAGALLDDPPELSRAERLGLGLRGELAYDTIAIPLQLVFPVPWTDGVKAIFWYYMLFWTTDMGWSVITGFHEKGKLEMRQQLVLKRYFSGWFWLDLLVVGLDWVTTATDSQGKTQRMVRILKTMRMARSLRLLRLMKLKALWEKLLDSITSNMVHVMIGIVRSMLMVTAVTHFVACLWYAVGTASADEGEG